MKTNFLLLNVILVLGLSGCSSFWENYAKRSSFTIGYQADNVGDTNGKGVRSVDVNAVIRGSNNSISKIYQSLSEFTMYELGLSDIKPK